MKRIFIPIFTLLFSALTTAQTSISFYHLGNTTYQNSSLNPAWIPEGRWFVGMPGLSGIHAHVNSKFSYNKIITVEEDQKIVDVKRALGDMQSQNMISVQANVNLFHIGYASDAGTTLSFFANERAEADLLAPKQVVDAIWNGTVKYIDEEINVGRSGGRGTHFREIGLGIAYPMNNQLDVGARLKYLMGFFDVSTPGNMKAKMTVNNVFEIDTEYKRTQVRSSGIDIYEGTEDDLASHLIISGNSGASMDLGFHYKLSKDYSIAGSILDIGWISWKKDIRNETLVDSTFRYEGLDLNLRIHELRQSLQDSLFDSFKTRETYETYRSWLPIKVYGSWIYHRDKQTDYYGTLGTRMIHGRLNMLYGAGVTRRFGEKFTGSLSIIKLPQQFINVGAAFAVRAGFAQMYMAVDQLGINYSAFDLQAFDFRYGINFIFNQRKQRKDVKEASTVVFLGKSVKSKRKEDIYSIIKKQKRRKIKQQKRKENKKKATRKSLTGEKF